MTRSSMSQLDPVAIRAELRSILLSPFVPEGSLLARILTYVVERTLAGDGRSIKAYTIAVEALGRNPNFNPDRDSTVRVAAMRLRNALDLYYDGPGAANVLRIRLVPGCYRPTFEEAVLVESAPVAPATAEPGRLAQSVKVLTSTRMWLLALTVALGADLAMTLSLMASQRTPETAVYDLINQDIQRSYNQRGGY
ncbi:hypothetical protein E8L99_13945 [Phreatobacter aquaticus]|uniref:Uncharacterized protein n=1 Tax=Phreatobacter aquaticus TaxID=2570229 RepID=A0A4D7QP87_9HYPH|nr:hypothetical protein [Phreatobacter aquaticus]QCK86777.1 hypothetical protein E8L99_13945 [Phreatobacter aquaticus]